MENNTPTDTSQPAPTPTPPPKKSKVLLFSIIAVSILVLAIGSLIIFKIIQGNDPIATVLKNALYHSTNSGGNCGYPDVVDCSSGHIITQEGDIVRYPEDRYNEKYGPVTTGKIDDSTLDELKDLSTQVLEQDLIPYSALYNTCDGGTTKEFIYNLASKEWVTLSIDIDCTRDGDKINNSPAARRILEIANDIDWGYSWN